MVEIQGPHSFMRYFERYDLKLGVVSPVLNKERNVYELTIYAARNKQPGYIRERFDFELGADTDVDSLDEDFYFQLVIMELVEHWELIRNLNRSPDPWDPVIPKKENK